MMDQGNLIARKMCLLLKVKRPVPTRSMNSVCTKNLAFQIEQGNLWNCLKTIASCMLTMEQENLWNTHSEITICSWRKSWHCVIQHWQRVQPCNQRGEHRFQHSRITILQWNNHMASTFKVWFRRSRTTLIDMHCISKRSSTKSTI